MSKRKITSFKAGNIEIKVHYESEWQEFSVSLWEGGVKNEGATYFTNDRNDALVTADAMLASNS